MSYSEFIRSKKSYPEPVGFEISESEINPSLFDWQRKVVQWAVRRGRAALWQDCGLGKTLQQLEWARLVHQRTSGPVLILAPLAVAEQTLRESVKFSIDCPVRIVATGDECGPGINVTNYEKLHHFDGVDFAGVVLDESSILKSFTGATKQKLCKRFEETPFRLACTATPAPNDRMELGNHSQFLGVMPSDEMLERFFINDTMRAGGYRLRKHAEGDFWDWMSCWAVCITKPSDLGFSDDGFVLPGLEIVEHLVESDSAGGGLLFDTGSAISATTVHQEKRRCLADRVSVVAELVNSDSDCWAVWCDTDYEADALRKAIRGSVEVRGSQPDNRKAAGLAAFADGSARVIVTKPEIGGWGLNWQHCNKTTWFAGYSFERFYQSIRRLYRFGQVRTVYVHCVMSDREESIMKTVKRKQAEHGEMFAEMANKMRAGMLERVVGVRKLVPYSASNETKIPNWLGAKQCL